MKKALITGVTGQDGSYLAELLLKKGYEVHGIIRRTSTFNTSRIIHIYQEIHEKNIKFFLQYGDLADGSVLNQIIKKIKPDEVYNLGAQSHVRVSFDIPEYTADITGLGTLRLLDAIRESGIKTKLYHASSSEMFGNTTEIPQKETTHFVPCSPYAISKVFAYWTTLNYRQSYNMFVCNGILFNHESPRRGETFVSRKITRAATRIKLGLQDKLFLGNLEAKRDWGYAPEYVEAMWLMLQQEKPDDFIIATNEMHSVKEFLEEAFGYLGLNWKEHVKIEPHYFRPTEVEQLQGDYSKAKNILGWKPRTKFKELVRLMVDSDMELAKNEKYLKEKNHK